MPVAAIEDTLWRWRWVAIKLVPDAKAFVLISVMAPKQRV